MKKVLIGIIAFSLIMGGCKKIITEVPYSFLTPQNFPASAEEADLALNGCYSMIKHTDIWDYRGNILMNSQNDLTWTTYYAPALKWGKFISPTNGREGSWWTYYWKGINALNNLIEALQSRDEVKSPWVIPKVAEARALRAFYYHHLAMLFGDLPLRLKPTKEAVFNAPRSPVQAIYDSIILPDLAFADGKLPVTNTPSGRISAGAVKCIMADVYLKLAGWRRSSQGEMVAGDPKYWAMARDAAKAVLDMETAGVYAMESEYKMVFTKLQTDVATHEVIFDLESNDKSGSNIPFAYGAPPASPTTGGGGNYLHPIPEWLRTLDTEDERYQWNIGPYKYSGWDRIPVADTLDWGITTFQKIFPSDGYWQNNLTNWPWYRLSDVKLMYAEAANEANGGPTPEAYKQINEVRYRARPEAHKTDGMVLPDLSGLTQEQFREAVRKERAMELLCEGKRRMDLIRWGIWEEKIAGLGFYDDALNSVGGFDKRYYLWAIPQNEINATGWQQNAGY